MVNRRKFLAQSAASTAMLLAASRETALADGDGLALNTPARMSLRKIPRTDLTVSRLAFGCAMLGWDWNSSDFVAQTIPVIRSAYERGVTFFDLADVYGNGGSERALGEILRQSPGLRHQLVIQSKCGDRFKDSSTIDNSSVHIINSVEGSLRRLGTDHLDILLLHWPDSLVQPEEVARAFDELKHHGKVRYFGVSNHSPSQFELLQKYVRQPLIANQIQLGLLHWYLLPQGIKTSWTHGAEGVTTLDYCRLHDIWVQAYSPMSADDIGTPLNVFNPAPTAPPEIRELATMLGNLAEKYNANRGAVMLAWLLRHPAGITPIIGTTKAQHLADDCVADRIELTREEWYGLLATASKIRFPATG